MEDFRLGNFDAVTSEVVAAEIEPAPTEVKSKYDELKDYGVEVTSEVVELADSYRNRQILSPNYRDDGLHIAAATIHEVDIFDQLELQAYRSL